MVVGVERRLGERQMAPPRGKGPKGCWWLVMEGWRQVLVEKEVEWEQKVVAKVMALVTVSARSVRERVGLLVRVAVSWRWV